MREHLEKQEGDCEVNEKKVVCHTGFLFVSPPAACQGESLKPSENGKGESNNVEVYLWSISRWHHRSCDDVPVAD